MSIEKSISSITIAFLIVGLLIGAGGGYFVSSSSLQPKINDLEEQVASLNTEVVDLETFASVLSVENKNFESQVSELNTQISELNSQISSLEIELQDTNTIIKQRNDRIAELEAAINASTPKRTIIVTSTADSGSGTLRQALLMAESGDIITFHPAFFPPDAPTTIFVNTGLPHIRQSNLTLDASQTGVILDGSNIQREWVAGLHIVSSDANTIWGLQIINFPGPGIAISGDAKHNVVGGDRSLGAGPFGRGNMLSNNVIGIDLSTSMTSLNTVTGNLIGTDTEGTDTLGNYLDGVSLTIGAHNNTIGPDNIIANNGRLGVYYEPIYPLQNTITHNSIFDNGVGKGELAAPIILDYDLSAGSATGITCDNCTVEIFSTSSYEGEIFEGQTTANELGLFSFNKGAPFTGPYLTATTTDMNGRTSEFSASTVGTSRFSNLQEGNNLQKTRLDPKHSRVLEDNRIGCGGA